jgi:hypothetical protein
VPSLIEVEELPESAFDEVLASVFAEDAEEGQTELFCPVF